MRFNDTREETIVKTLRLCRISGLHDMTSKEQRLLDVMKYQFSDVKITKLSQSISLG